MAQPSRPDLIPAPAVTQRPHGEGTPSGASLFKDPRSDRERIAALDLWRVHLEQCPDCGHVHGRQGAGKFATLIRPERHIYEYTQAVPDDLNCTLCGDVFQNPSQIPCGHHFCSSCIRALLARGTGRANCPLDGQIVTRFAALPSDEQLLLRLSQLRVRCPVCREDICIADLQLHLQDPVCMVESAEAYRSILHPFYLSCPLSNFTVGEFNGTSALIRLYRKLGPVLLKRFVLTTESFIVLPDPKMGFQPQSEEDAGLLRREGGYFNAWWVHPAFRQEVWWHTGDAEAEAQQAARSPTDSASKSFHEAVRSPTASEGKQDAGRSLLGSSDCSSEPWHQSSFVHTWSSVRKPTQPRYLCCARDLRGEDLPMLEKFYKDVLHFLKVQYSVPEERVWVFAHYPASARYSTLHFHIIFEGSEAGRFSKYARKLERPHQLSRQFSLVKLIELIRADPSHFETCTLNYYLGDKADLMDPVCAFYGCSPHRYIQDFTFHWDPGAVGVPASEPKVLAEGGPTTHSSTGKTSQTTLRDTDRVLTLLHETRRSVETLRSVVDEVRTLAREAKDARHAEEAAAHRFAALLAGTARLPLTENWFSIGFVVGVVSAIAVAAALRQRH